MTPGTIMHLAGKVTTKRNGLTASYTLDKKARVTVLMLRVTGEVDPTEAEIDVLIEQALVRRKAEKS